MFVIFAAGLVFFIIGSLRLRDLRRLYVSALTHKELAVLEKVLLHQAGVEKALDERVGTLEKEMSSAKSSALQYIQHCALERYRAFKDVGGDQSFSMALLDANGDGAILTSIYGRDECRIFAKQVVKGKPTHPLAEEERKLLASIREDSRGKEKDNQTGMAKKG
jgi:hypothetical protein